MSRQLERLLRIDELLRSGKRQTATSLAEALERSERTIRNDIAFLRDRCRTFRAVEQPLSAQVILDEIRNQNRQRVLVICNTVSFAQGLYRDLEALKQNDIELRLLPSRFLPEDRKETEESLEKIFGKKWQENTDGSGLSRYFTREGVRF